MALYSLLASSSFLNVYRIKQDANREQLFNIELRSATYRTSCNIHVDEAVDVKLLVFQQA